MKTGWNLRCELQRDLLEEYILMDSMIGVSFVVLEV